jgi:histidine triad (HIT) family protein
MYYYVVMTDSLFTKIIKGEIPCHKIYEDERTFVILDIYPIQPGQAIVICKTQVPDFLAMSPEDSLAMWETINKVGRRMREVFPDKKRIGVMIEGLDVEHAHAKVFAFDTGEEYRAEQDMTAEPDHAALAAMAQKLAF